MEHLMSNQSGFAETGPSDDGVYHVFSLCYAKGRARRAPGNFMAKDIHDAPMPIDYNLWILHNAYRTILVDTGYGQRAAAERDRPLEIDPLDALRQLGIDPDEVEDIIVTHLHYDHAGNIGRFAKARFHIQDNEVSFATGRCMCEPVMRFAFDVEDVVTLVRHTYAERVVFHNGDAAPFPGITLHALPGHSAVVQGVRVQTPRGPVLLASDSTHFFANFLRRSPFVLTVDVGATLRSYQRIRELGGEVARIVPGHDPKIRRLYPSRVVNGIELTLLHEPPKGADEASLSRLDDF
jgi:glyoxylase-like metal-dependent hydrolase (beta-lactamase superfamily II)